jgi:hypothetical protein
MDIDVSKNSVLDRSAIETFISVAPPTWCERIDVIKVEPFNGGQIVMSYFRKERILGVHIPNEYKGTPLSAVLEVAITIQAISEYGMIPKQLGLRRLLKYKRNCKNLERLLV